MPAVRRGLCVSMVLALTACAGGGGLQQPTPFPPPPLATFQPDVPDRVGPVRVALLLPLTGDAADVGNDMLDAAQMAIFDVDARSFVLLPFDTKGTREGAQAAIEAAIEREAELILGPLFAASTMAIRERAREAGLSVLSFSNDASVATEGVWALGFRPEEQVRRIIDYALEQGYDDIALIAPDNAYGTRALVAWRGIMRQREDDVPEKLAALYPAGQQDRAQVLRRVTAYDGRQQALENERRRLRGSNDPAAQERLQALATADTYGSLPFDAVLVADGGPRLREIGALLNYYDANERTTQALGTMLWQEDPTALLEAPLQEGWIATISPELDEVFYRRFEQFFGREPVSLAGLAYDATALAAVIASSDRTFPEDLLTDGSGFIGRAGIFRLREDGLTDHGLAVVAVDAGDFRVLDPAPSSFAEDVLTQ